MRLGKIVETSRSPTVSLQSHSYKKHSTTQALTAL